MRDRGDLPLLIYPRSSWVRERLDPVNTLPNVHLEQIEDRILARGLASYNLKIDHTSVGGADLDTTDTRGWKFAHIIREQSAPKGTGLAAYILMIEAAHNAREAFIADTSLTPAAKRMWDRLVSAGVATVVRPPVYERDPNEPTIGFYVYGDIRVLHT